MIFEKDLDKEFVVDIRDVITKEVTLGSIKKRRMAEIKKMSNKNKARRFGKKVKSRYPDASANYEDMECDYHDVKIKRRKR